MNNITLRNKSNEKPSQNNELILKYCNDTTVTPVVLPF
jgi:hypothetical protein